MIKILQAGVAKSGNYWLYQILKELYKYNYELSEINSFIKSVPEYNKLKKEELSYKDQVNIDTVEINKNHTNLYVSSIFKRKITNLDEYVKKASIIWTHSEFNSGAKKLIASVDKVIYIVRDPRDVFLSKINFAFGNYSLKYLKKRTNKKNFRKNRVFSSSFRWTFHICRAILFKKKYPNKIYFVFYENLLSNPTKEIKKLADFLEFDLDYQYIKNIALKTSASFLRKEDSSHVSKTISLYKWKSKINEQEAKIIDIRS